MSEKSKKAKVPNKTVGGDAVYGLGIIGALVYYLQVADGFWMILFAFFKALVWPAFVIYDVLKFIH